MEPQCSIFVKFKTKCKKVDLSEKITIDLKTISGVGLHNNIEIKLT